MRLSRGRYSTADPNNWGSRYGAYSQTLDSVNGDLAGQRLTNGAEFLSRMAQGAALPGSVDYTAPLTWYDSADSTGARKLIDGGGRLLYDAAASAADDTIRRTVTMGLAGMPLPSWFSPEVAEKLPQLGSSLMAAVNTYADNYAAYSADGTPIAQAKGLAVVDSALEAVSEFLPFERLLKIPDITPETVSDTVKEVILSSVKEIPEELASARIGGREYPINADYRDILEIFSYLDDPDRPEYIRWKIALALFYEGEIPQEDTQEAMEYLAAFISCGEESGRPGPRLLDWNQDAQAIVADVNAVAGREIRAPEFVHWWTFLSWFHAIGEG